MSFGQLHTVQALANVARLYIKPWACLGTWLTAAVRKLWPRAPSAVGAAGAAVFVLLGAYSVVTLAERMNVPTVYSASGVASAFVPLEDGSTIKLAPGSEASVHFAQGLRSVVLVRGEAFFTVRHDLLRPFQVRAGRHVVRDLGTEFNVRLRQNANTEVAVAAGLVAVFGADHASAGALPSDAQKLKEGQGAVFAPDSARTVRVYGPAETLRKLSWRNGTLRFEGETLSEAVAELNRFRSEPLVIEDPSIADRKFGGVLDPRDDQAILSLLNALGVQSRLRREGNMEYIHLFRGPEVPYREPSPH